PLGLVFQGLLRVCIVVFLKDQPYGVAIKPLIRGSVDAMRQHCPAKRLTPMGLFVNGRKTTIIMA
uniref:hypothetical protein n=1 Tax=Alloprevotella tannerae TaxID=76122 RepID=UPI0028E2006C